MLATLTPGNSCPRAQIWDRLVPVDILRTSALPRTQRGVGMVERAQQLGGAVLADAGDASGDVGVAHDLEQRDGLAHCLGGLPVHAQPAQNLPPATPPSTNPLCASPRRTNTHI
eukprot:3345433-Rhodomonas_salina.1